MFLASITSEVKNNHTHVFQGPIFSTPSTPSIPEPSQPTTVSTNPPVTTPGTASTTSTVTTTTVEATTTTPSNFYSLETRFFARFFQLN